MPSSTRHALRSAWTDLGWGGRGAAALLVGATIVGIVLGVAIPRAARHHLLDGRSSALRSVAAALHDIPDPANGSGDIAEFDDRVRTLLLGGETVGAKVWSPDGVILYATDPTLIGTVAALPAQAARALDGVVSTDLVDGHLHPELGTDGRVIEFFFPGGEDEVAGTRPSYVFEIEQLATTLDQEVARISRTVWSSIGIALGLLVVVLGAVAVAFGRSSERQRRHIEMLLREALGAQESERKRIVAALHKDVGQRLYRVLYGLEGIRSRGLQSPASAEELPRLEGLVREIDTTLRSELRMLHRDAIQEIGFGPALRELTETTRLETGLAVEVLDRLDPAPPPEIAGLLLWAAEEAVINARKHAGATSITIEAWQDGPEAVIRVEDDGVGVTGPEGIGLMTLTDRLRLAGGELVVESRRGAGTRVVARVPHSRVTR